MEHMNTPALARFCIGFLIEQIRNRSLTVPALVHDLARMGNGPEGVVMILNALVPFTDMDDETWELRLQGPYERHDDETLARMVWQQLLAGACAQHPAHS